MKVSLGEVSSKAFELEIWAKDDVCSEAVTLIMVRVRGDGVGAQLAL
jgi:hypothetical protein